MRGSMGRAKNNSAVECRVLWNQLSEFVKDSLWQAVGVWAACAVVLSVPAWLWLARGDLGKQLLAVQVLFDTVRFPVIVKMTS